MDEIWKDINETYSISNFGKVKNKKRNRILKPQKLGGYYAVYLSNKTKQKQEWKYIHRLVAEAFIPNPDNLPQVNHKDENKTNNTVWINDDGSINYDKTNLEWCTQKYNMNYGTFRNRLYDTNLEKGKFKTDYRTLSEEEIKEKKREYRRKYYREHNKCKNYKLIIYEVVKTYKQILECDNFKEAAIFLDMSKQNLYYYINSDKIIQNNGKLFLIKQINK